MILIVKYNNNHIDDMYMYKNYDDNNNKKIEYYLY